MKVIVVGAGFSGAVIARCLADEGHQILVLDERSHVGGNCHTARDPRSGVMVHQYGPHIFHTNNELVWNYVNEFDDMMPYVNRVKATVKGQVYSLPINLHTINQFYQKALSPDEAKSFVSSIAAADIEAPENFEQQALKFIGEDLYKAFFYGYTRKQWGVEPRELPASILKRLPLRFNYDDNYFNHKFQGMPRNGYTYIIEKILSKAGIEVRLNSPKEQCHEDFDHIVYTGALDRYFDYQFGQLGYRTLDFESFHFKGDFQGNAMMNYCDMEVPFTRIAEHKHFAPWETNEQDQSICFREYSRACGRQDIPFYPIRLAQEKSMLAQYVDRAMSAPGVTFAGRLGTYSYLDMDVTILRALETAKALGTAWKQGRTPPVFVHDVL